MERNIENRIEVVKPSMASVVIMELVCGVRVIGTIRKGNSESGLKQIFKNMKT
jgi:hypothetical protein